MENTEGAFKNIGNSEKLATLDTQDTERRQTKQTAHYYTKTNTNNVNKTWVLLQATGGNDERNIVVMYTQISYALKYYSSCYVGVIQLTNSWTVIIV